MLRKSSALIAAGAILVSLGSTVHANDKVIDTEGGTNWLDHIATSSGGPRVNTIKGSHLGSAASAASAARQIDLRPGEKYVNVTRGEIALIKADGKAFAWKFDTLGTSVFNLSDIAPKDINVQGVRVYVARDPYEVGG